MDLDNRQDGLVHGQMANASVSSRQNATTEANHPSSSNGINSSGESTTSSATHTHAAPFDDNGILLYYFVSCKNKF
jgi:hypothetical protein